MQANRRQPFALIAEGHRHSVLVVEDEVLLRMSIGAYLRQRGYAVFETPSADEACQVLVAGIQADALFTDISLPGSMDGISLARYARLMLPAAKIILATAFDRLALSARDLCEHDALLTKPYAYEAIDSTMARLLGATKAAVRTGGSSQPVSPGTAKE